ncbi:NADPH-dependent diflavin oxidoreductase 1 [Escovopsis weberi]|uniref:NADPH-dependent diflavin oxidoreductase 1 n=1 Tax=Escovopsis weberi TaxID=150374 RepID=A0A0M8MXU0_ESCWE|nr:NADPH-dependent diflavin oxidoreductase 1 [Escovopsis weberi]
MKDPGRSVLILFGSETGNAQDIAEELGRLCQRLHFKSHVEELNGVELSALLQHQLVIFVISTTGQGDMPHNSLTFWKKLLRKKLPPGCLGQLRYTCFGLGDSAYLKFNWAARKLVRRLEQLGATTFTDVCEADEQFPDGIDGSFARWADTLRTHLLESYPPPAGLEPIPDDTILPPKWSLEPALSKLKAGSANLPDFTKLSLKKGQTDGIQNGSPDFSAQLNQPPTEALPVPDGWTATLAENKRLTPSTHWQDVRLVSFNIPPRESGERLEINPGDCLTLYPKNSPADAQKLISLMGWDHIADQPLDLSACGPLPQNLFAPEPCTLRALLLHNIDITAIPRRSFLKSMSYFTSDEYHRQRLLEFTMTEYLDEYFDYATRSRRSIIEVLEEFTSVKIPAARLLDVFPLIRGRDFSIANGGASLAGPAAETNPHATSNSNSHINFNTDTATGTRVQLLVALVKYRTVLRKPREGLCSRYLAPLPPGSSLRVSHKPVLSPIHGPANALRPLIAIGTGTGIAPIRALVQERLTHPAAGPALVFFGNRNRDADFFFEHEWPALQKNAAAHTPASASASPPLHLFTAFSRDQREKIYVQDVLRREAPRIRDLIAQRPIFAVCGGSSKMADACKRAVFEPFLKLKEGEASGAAEKSEEERMKELLASVTWWQEIW